MDLLSQHEAFLRAIYDSPEDDTPRLVYADFWSEHGDPDRGDYIRLACEYLRTADHDRQGEILTQVVALWSRNGTSACAWPWCTYHTPRGFPHPDKPIHIDSTALDDPTALRRWAVERSPEWFGTRTAKVLPPVVRPEWIEVLLGLPFTQNVREWDFSGQVEERAGGGDTEDGGAFALIDMDEKPVITVACVEALCEVRALRRVEVLNLTHNNLDNDAARALVRCPYLVNLKKLDLYDGNRFRGKTWSQLIERFGEGVVG